MRDVATDQQNGGLKVELVIDRDTASRLGILPQAIDDALYDAFGQRQVSTMFTQLNQYHVVLEVDLLEHETDRDRETYLVVPGFSFWCRTNCGPDACSLRSTNSVRCSRGRPSCPARPMTASTEGPTQPRPDSLALRTNRRA